MVIPHEIQLVYHRLSVHTSQSQPRAALRREYFEEIHWSIFILGKVPSSILSRCGRTGGWKVKRRRSQHEQRIGEKKREERNEKLRSIEYKCGLNVERSVECSAASRLLGSPAATLLLLPSVCRWRHCREEGFHIGWCHLIHISPSCLFLSFPLHMCRVSTLSAGGWYRFGVVGLGWCREDWPPQRRDG